MRKDFLKMIDSKTEPERQICPLHLSKMDKMNVRLPKRGDGTKALEEV